MVRVGVYRVWSVRLGIEDVQWNTEGGVYGGIDL